MGKALAVRIFAVLMGLFSLTLVFLSLQEFYLIDFKPPSVDFKNIEANKLDIFELNASSTKANYQAASWQRYLDKDIFNKVFVYGFDFNASTNTLVLTQNGTTLQGNVRYADDNGTRVETQRLFYDNKKKILSTKSDFKVYRKDNLLTGTAFDYNVPKKVLKIQGVKAWFD